jgi:F0F1-type ATP synthase delta subunit
MAPKDEGITLPVGIVSPTDIARLTREIEGIDNFFRDQKIRSGGETNAMPRLSKLMDQLATENKINLLVENDRNKILTILEQLHKSAPILHISFSVDPPGAYVQKVVSWLRRNVHQYALVTVGLQPNIGAGCVVRTTNKMFDFSLREFFAEKRDFFVEKLHMAITDPTFSQNSQPAPTPVVDVQPSAVPTPIAVVSAPQQESHS